MMNYVEQSIVEYEYYKLAKRMETFSFKCHFFELSLNRALDFIRVMNEHLSKGLHEDWKIEVPYKLYNVDTEIHWSYYQYYRGEIAACHSLKGIEWPNPISLSNQLESNNTDSGEVLEGLSLESIALLIKVILLDLVDESNAIETEKKLLHSDYCNPDNNGAGGFFVTINEMLNQEQELRLQRIAEKRRKGNEKEAERTEEMFMKTPFQKAREAINEIILPQIDSVLCRMSQEG